MPHSGVVWADNLEKGSATLALTTQGFKVDYVTARNATTLAVPAGRGEPLRLIAAAWLGKTRLIDNSLLVPPC